MSEYTYEGTCDCSTHYLTFGALLEKKGNGHMPKCYSYGKKIKLDKTWETIFDNKKIISKEIVPNIEKAVKV